MKHDFNLRILAVLLTLFLSGCSAHEKSYIKASGPEVISFRALPFELTDVKLLDGPFLHATESDIRTLLNYDADRLLSRFYTEAGLKPKADHYPGWENESLAGHSLGHYLSACSMMYQTSGEKRFLERVNYIVDELKLVQDTVGNGYIGAFTDGKKIFENEVARGDIRAKGFDLNGIWSPFYTQHKILAGLRDAYRYCGNAEALEVEKNFADWIGQIVGPLNDIQMQSMLRCEYGGINETLADLFSDTNDKKYLRLSERFYQKAILDSLKAGFDVLPGKHCNTNIPKLIGLSRIYELTGDTSERRAAEFFWQTVVRNHSYVTGGNGNKEYFGPAGRLRDRLGPETTESCNVYNMLKLTEHLFEWEASAQSADFYERALFNHILSSQNPETGNVTYNLSLQQGGFKAFQDPLDFTCCIGTGMENHSKYGKNIYFHNDNELFVFQYIASRLTWKEKGLTVIQKTSYPEEQGTVFEFTCEKPVRLTLQIRYPGWAKKGIEVKVNGSKKRVNKLPGSFVEIERTWKTGDIVEVTIPFTLRLESMPDDSNRVAVMYGPLVLAGDLGPLADSTLADKVPVLATDNRDPSVWMRSVNGKPNTFVNMNGIEMKPFYSIFDRRYSVYWDLFPETGSISGKGQQEAVSAIQYTLSMPDPTNHCFHIELSCSGWNEDTICFKMPRWMPGYYQIMDYGKEVKNFSAKDQNGKNIIIRNPDWNTWQLIIKKGTPFSLAYDVKADRKFVANSYLDTTHGYIVTAGAFMYIRGHIYTPVSLTLIQNDKWTGTATGLDPVHGTTNQFTASDFDILYDCPILMGNLEELPSFMIKGIEHRFMAWEPGSFDREEFMQDLKRVIKSGTDIFGDIPYKQYTFIGIGPGFGGIEHLNNTTVSFDGNRLKGKASMIRILSYLGHEYFHNFNVKRIRPYELGPFDYDKENRTNLLWVSEGLTVYYEYLIVKRAGLMNERELFTNFESNIDAYENDPGRLFQSLSQASFNTWSDGPFGNRESGPDKAISYYDKGPVIGMILDFTIRNATLNKKSLDDVMRLLYRKYYKELNRGFTDAEFQEVCELVAGVSLAPEFEYVYTKMDIDYSAYLSYAGLQIDNEILAESGTRKFTISRLKDLNSLQKDILQSWTGN